MRKLFILFSVLVITAILLTACGSSAGNNKAELTASGTITADEVKISAEVAGKVKSINVHESDLVTAGQELLVLDDALIQSQIASADAAITTAKAGVLAAEANAASAVLALKQVVNSRQQLDTTAQINLWKKPNLDEIETPEWYFTPDERTAAAKTEMDIAAAAFQKEQDNLAQVVKTINLPELSEMLERVALADEAYRNARNVRVASNNAATQQDLDEASKDLIDLAKDELDAARTAFDILVSSTDRDNLSEARASMAIARQRYDEAVVRYNNLIYGTDALEVQTADARVKIMEAALAQAKAMEQQSEAAKQTILVQLDKTIIKAPSAGVVLTRNIEPGEMLSPGASALVIGQLERLNLIVYLPEDRYGEVFLGQDATVTVDSFAGEIFTGKVTRIADKAEFTPRNVQTQDGRKTTVFAIEIELLNPDLKLKPGMPADVSFK